MSFGDEASAEATGIVVHLPLVRQHPVQGEEVSEAALVATAHDCILDEMTSAADAAFDPLDAQVGAVQPDVDQFDAIAGLACFAYERRKPPTRESGLKGEVGALLEKL